MFPYSDPQLLIPVETHVHLAAQENTSTKRVAKDFMAPKISVQASPFGTMNETE